MPDADEEDGSKLGADEDPPAPRRTRGVMPEPSEATKGRPVPRPVRRRAPAGPEPRPPESASPQGETGAPGGPASPWAKGAGPPGGISHTVSRSTEPGITQASLGGGIGETVRGGFTKHKLRGEERVNVGVDVTVSYRFVAARAPEKFPTHFRGRLLDISMGGAQIEGPIAPEVDRDELKRGAVTIDAVFELPFVENPLKIAASVNWIKPSAHPRSYIGLKFIRPTEQQKRIIRAFLIGLHSPTRQKFRRGR